MSSPGQSRWRLPPGSRRRPPDSLDGVRSLRFLLSRRWILFALVGRPARVGRLAARRVAVPPARGPQGAATRSSSATRRPPPAPVADVLAPGRPVAADDEWRRGRRPPGRTPSTTPWSCATRPATAPPASTSSCRCGPRRHRAARRPRLARRPTTRATDPSDVPPPAGRRGDGHRLGPGRRRRATAPRSATSRPGRSPAREIGDGPRTARCTAASSTSRRESRSPAEPLEPAELPDLDNGPHFFYGLQWWFFGLLALFGFFYLAYDEWRAAGGRGTSAPPSRPDATRRPAHAKSLRDDHSYDVSG